MFTDTYLKAADKDVLSAFCEQFSCFISPVPGRKATEEINLGDGSVIAEQSAVGDPGLFYACIRTEGAVDLPQDIMPCESSLGVQLVGKWL